MVESAPTDALFRTGGWSLHAGNDWFEFTMFVEDRGRENTFQNTYIH